MRLWVSVVLSMGVAGAAWAEGPYISLRPVARGEIAQGVMPVAPETLGAERAVVAEPKRKGLFSFLRPNSRPKKVEKQARVTKKTLAKGMVCGDPALQGDAIGAVKGAQAGCGVANAVRLRSVSGIGLSQQSVMDCTTAKALKSWVDKGLKPAIGKRGGGVAQIRVAAHYACRTRNNQRGAKISEHGKGRAIDISGFTLRNGEEITVINGWGARADRKALRAMHKRACGPFGTVLGPNANKFHRDHFHFDTARYRGGSYCK